MQEATLDLVVPPPPGRSSGASPWRTRTAATILAASAGPAIWSWLGEHSLSAHDDYLLRPVVLSPGQVAAIRFVLTLAVAGSLITLAVGHRHRRLRPLLVTETTLSTVLSLALGAGYCVVTDGVTGANIGGGLVLLLAGPLTLAALALGVVLAVIDRRQSAHRAA